MRGQIKGAIYLTIPVALLAATLILTQTASGATGREREEMLRSLPYVQWSEIEPEEEGKGNVTIYDPGRACPGINLFCSEPSPTAYFMDLEGGVLHNVTSKNGRGCWMVEPLPWGGVAMLLKPGLAFLNWDSTEALLNRKIESHHDLAVSEEGRLYVLTNVKREGGWRGRRRITDNVVQVLDREGEKKIEISFAEMVSNERELLDLVPNQSKDLFHVNALELVEGDFLSHNHTPFEEGQLLFCSRHLNVIGAFDPEEKEITWWWGEGVLDHPHDPTLLESGNVLVFDNGNKRGFSRVIEVDPVREEIVWEYVGDPPDSFFAENRGSAQRLPNGNTLIVESTEGRAFEVTPQGEIVWEFHNTETKRTTHKVYVNGTRPRFNSEPRRVGEKHSQAWLRSHPRKQRINLKSDINLEGEAVHTENFTEPQVEYVNRTTTSRATIYRMRRLSWEEWKRLSSV